MLQTPAIKADASAAASSVKDKDLASTALQTDFSNYFSQMMAAQAGPDPSAQGSALAQDPVVPSTPPPRRPAESARKPAQADDHPGQGPAPAGADPGSQAPVQAQAGAASGPAPAPAQTAPQASAADGQGSGAKLPVGLTSAAAGGAALAMAGGAAKPTADSDPAPAADPGPASGASAPAPAPSAPGATDSARAALDQAYPGGKFQVQYDQDASAATTKPPLSEFLNQIQMEPRPSIGGQAVEPVASPAPVPIAGSSTLGLDPVSGLQALQAPQLAAQTALLAMPATETIGAVGATSAVAAGNATTAAAAAAALALGAGAMAGASGAVRVTATRAPAEANPLPTPQQSLLEQVDGTIRYLVKNQDQSAELQLHPESLGRIQVKLKVDGTVVHAKIWASEASAVPIMQEHRSFLESSLKAQGMTLGSFDLQHGRRDDQTPMPAAQAPPMEPAPGLDLIQAGQDSPGRTQASALTSGIEYVA